MTAVKWHTWNSGGTSWRWTTYHRHRNK